MIKAGEKYIKKSVLPIFGIICSLGGGKVTLLLYLFQSRKCRMRRKICVANNQLLNKHT